MLDARKQLIHSLLPVSEFVTHQVWADSYKKILGRGQFRMIIFTRYVGQLVLEGLVTYEGRNATNSAGVDIIVHNYRRASKKSSLE